MIGQSIRKILKRTFDRIRNEKLKQNLLQAIHFWIASLITGLIAVFYSGIFIAGLVSLLVDKHSLYDHLKVQCMQDLNHEI